MYNFQLIPWTFQYLFGSLIVLFLSIYLIGKNKGSWIYRVFFLYGLSLGLWQLFAFFHRNAPNSEISSLFLGLDYIMISLSVPLLFLMFLLFISYKLKYITVVLPAIILGLYICFFHPYEIIWAGDKLGWSYKLSSNIFNIYYIIVGTYFLATIITGIRLIGRSAGITRKKHTIILIGFLISSTGLMASNIWLGEHTQVPPLGGVFATLMFLIIAFAINLPDQPISSNKSLDYLESAYLEFLNKLKKIIPGRELGESSFKFRDYIDAMGMKKLVKVIDNSQLVFAPEYIDEHQIKTIPDNILKVMKKFEWFDESIQEFTTLLVRSYDILRINSRPEADDWFQKIIKKHGGFVYGTGIFAKLPERLIPELYKQMEKGRCKVFLENKEEAYQQLHAATEKGLQGLCLTKYDPDRLRDKYDFNNVKITWLTFRSNKKESTLSPKNIVQIQKTIAENINNYPSMVILIDCLREINVANGIENTIKFVKFLKSICKNHLANLLIILNLGKYSSEEKQRIAEILDVKLSRNSNNETQEK
ncbi:MAG: DUF835 domain-containing protein [Candidatus Marinimicrobia bacterium]|nr:DUF835 domain-containing protein [Candidatus Neomarinimicrobiota bacterium]